jgi:polyhydroxybutyrate depolymerase
MRFSVSRSWLFVAVAAAAFGLSPRVWACEGLIPCPVANGSYLVHPPADWDGRSPLPVIVFFHGAASTALDTMTKTGIPEAADSVGALLVAADGARRNWSFPGKNTTGRDDFAYTDSVLDDVERRFPVDRTSILASGFSVGGSMVWYLACLDAARFTAFAPVAGAFWEPMPENCPAGPVSLRHIHGTADVTVPMKGRSLRNGLFRQGDVEESVRRLRLRDACQAEPDEVFERDGLSCRTWSQKVCASGREVSICLHPEDHMIKAQWVADGFRWMKGLTRRVAGQ